jgi:pimeloyl-CoA synthetase
MKSTASNIGGRIFFFKPNVDLEALINVFERQSVLAAVPECDVHMDNEGYWRAEID